MLHDLKIWPEQFAALKSGAKRHEIRAFDRPYAVGDTLRLREYNPNTKTFSGDLVDVRITHITAPGTFGLPGSVGAMSIALATEFQ